MSEEEIPRDLKVKRHRLHLRVFLKKPDLDLTIATSKGETTFRQTVKDCQTPKIMGSRRSLIGHSLNIYYIMVLCSELYMLFYLSSSALLGGRCSYSHIRNEETGDQRAN